MHAHAQPQQGRFWRWMAVEGGTAACVLGAAVGSGAGTPSRTGFHCASRLAVARQQVTVGTPATAQRRASATAALRSASGLHVSSASVGAAARTSHGGQTGAAAEKGACGRVRVGVSCRTSLFGKVEGQVAVLAGVCLRPL